MSVHSIALRTAVGFESATSRLTDAILGAVEHDLAETLKAIAAEIGLCHIAYLRLSPDKSADICLLVAVVTYSRLWQHRYFVKKYIANDPVISYGRQAREPFDWTNLPVEDPATKAFFADALNHSVGRNGLSIPLRNRRGVFAVVSFTRDLAKGRMGDIQDRQYERAAAVVGSDRFGSEHQFQAAAAPGPVVDPGGAVSALGGARENLSGDCRNPGSGVRQRQNAPGRRPPQIALHELDRGACCGGYG
jgi:hypothetical protein